jgi:hypothetical protein
MINNFFQLKKNKKKVNNNKKIKKQSLYKNQIPSSQQKYIVELNKTSI